MTKNRIVGTHTAPDPDAITGLVLIEEYGSPEMKKAVSNPLLFLREGDGALTSMGLVLVDWGRGEFDHHGKENKETSASLIAKKLGIDNKKPIAQLLDLVKRSDLQGISLSFDASDIIKCVQRSNVSDKQKVQIGKRVVKNGLEFQQKKLERHNFWARDIIWDFIKEKAGIIPEKFYRYHNSLSNPKFERPFDLVEILEAERVLNEAEAIKFGKELLEFIYYDSKMFYEAQKEIRRSLKWQEKEITIIAGTNDNTKFNTAARKEGYDIIIQRNSKGHTQIFFNSNKIDWRLTETLTSVIRLEELLTQGRQIPEIDLRQPGKINEVPEWYYYRGQQIGKKKPGHFILNGSLTTPDVPPSKIQLRTLFDIVCKAVKYSPHFNWERWREERVKLYKIL